jgi:hypothetical protein
VALGAFNYQTSAGGCTGSSPIIWFALLTLGTMNFSLKGKKRLTIIKEEKGKKCLGEALIKINYR